MRGEDLPNGALGLFGRKLTEAKMNLSCEQDTVLEQPLQEQSMHKSSQSPLAKATFAAGCFWSIEETFRQLKGVINTAVGYEGGAMPNPSYQDVCTDRTGHAEVVEVEYDPAQLPYEKLLEAFWQCHDPTQCNRQGVDVGTQYRSAIFYHTPEQQKLAEASKQQLKHAGCYNQPIVTEIVPAQTFYRAEEHHQRYLEKKGIAHCALLPDNNAKKK